MGDARFLKTINFDHGNSQLKLCRITMDSSSLDLANDTEVINDDTMSAYIPCQICFGTTAEGCQQFQIANGCHSCDWPGCWNDGQGLKRSLNASSSCEFYGRTREYHADASMGDGINHIRQTDITCTADGIVIDGRCKPNWWTRYDEVRFVVNHTEHFVMGTASGEECNCLIDTLRQQLQEHCDDNVRRQLQLHCDIKTVREFVQAQDPDLMPGEYLELQKHWLAVLAGLGVFLDDDSLAITYKIVCVDVAWIGHGDVENEEGLKTLYIARQNANHFVPLLSVDALEGDVARQFLASSFCDADVDEDGVGDDSPGFSCVSGSKTSVSNLDCVEKTRALFAKTKALLEKEAAAAAVDSLAFFWEKTRAYLERESAKVPDAKAADPEAASSSSSVVSQHDASDEEVASSAYDSDASDLFHLEVEPAPTWETPQDKDLRIAHLLAGQMRRHPFLPPVANDENASTSFIDVQSGLKLPAAHCAFKGCCWTGLTKNSIEEHVITVHGLQLTAAESQVYGDKTHYGSSVFQKSCYALNMQKENQLLRRFFMGYYRQAIAERAWRNLYRGRDWRQRNATWTWRQCLPGRPCSGAFS